MVYFIFRGGHSVSGPARLVSLIQNYFLMGKNLLVLSNALFLNVRNSEKPFPYEHEYICPRPRYHKILSLSLFISLKPRQVVARVRLFRYM
jgi:hypothetical protein